MLSCPIDIVFKTLELTGGICRCGAVYALDRTGHNLGEVFLDALTFICRGDIDVAMSLSPDEYETIDFDYDIHTCRLGKNPKTGRSGKMIFIRLLKSGNSDT
jgi:hypothetical protein